MDCIIRLQKNRIDTIYDCIKRLNIYLLLGQKYYALLKKVSKLTDTYQRNKMFSKIYYKTLNDKHLKIQNSLNVFRKKIISRIKICRK